jgi:hypothetical protein
MCHRRHQQASLLLHPSLLLLSQATTALPFPPIMCKKTWPAGISIYRQRYVFGTLVATTHSIILQRSARTAIMSVDSEESHPVHQSRQAEHNNRTQRNLVSTPHHPSAKKVLSHYAMTTIHLESDRTSLAAERRLL